MGDVNINDEVTDKLIQLVNAFKKTNNVDIPFKIVDRRSGDIECVYSDASKAKEFLKWETKRSIEDICKDGYNFILHNENKR